MSSNTAAAATTTNTTNTTRRTHRSLHHLGLPGIDLTNPPILVLPRLAQLDLYRSIATHRCRNHVGGKGFDLAAHVGAAFGIHFYGGISLTHFFFCLQYAKLAVIGGLAWRGGILAQRQLSGEIYRGLGSEAAGTEECVCHGIVHLSIFRGDGEVRAVLIEGLSRVLVSDVKTCGAEPVHEETAMMYINSGSVWQMPFDFIDVGFGTFRSVVRDIGESRPSFSHPGFLATKTVRRLRISKIDGADIASEIFNDNLVLVYVGG
ncbi:hypothetical protein KC351_g41 [Hortaea werneckii]|nr:hypothetical protein KC351_g41 [Hortaea werneckii]